MTNGAPWYNYPRIDNIGQPDTTIENSQYPNGAPKPDSNIEVPNDTPATAPASGIITDIDTSHAWSDAITVRFDNAPNQQATHYVFLHLNNIAPNISVGQHVNAGDVLGYSGPNPQNAALGFALYPGDAYGTDTAWAGYDTVPNVTGAFNPVPYITQLQTANCQQQCAPLAANAFAYQACLQSCQQSVASGQGVTSPANTLTNPLTSIGNFFNSIQGLTTWLSNPARIAKLLAGIALVIGSFFLFAKGQEFSFKGATPHGQ